jgi:hypothetical protein
MERLTLQLVAVAELVDDNLETIQKRLNLAVALVVVQLNHLAET